MKNQTKKPKKTFRFDEIWQKIEHEVKIQKEKKAKTSVRKQRTGLKKKGVPVRPCR